MMGTNKAFGLRFKATVTKISELKRENAFESR